jgi:hypothetical protein
MSALSPFPLLGGRFRLGEKIGGSAGTETWRATEAGTDRTYTVLILETGGAPPQPLAERVLAASRIQHSSILPTVDAGVTDDGRLFVVREQMPGGNLAAYVRRNGPLSPRKAAAVVRGLLGALDAAHANGIVHGEVEPAKVSVGTDNKPRLTGLGLAGIPPRTERPFAAPEVTDPSSADVRSDVYSAGATLFTLVTGKPPTGLPESAIGDGPLAGIPAALSQVIHRATRSDPGDRYASAAEMLADLKAIAAVLPQASASPPVAANDEPPARAAPTIAISLDAPLPPAAPGRDEETPTQLFDRDVIKMALGDLDRSSFGDLQPAIDGNAADEPSVATMPAGGADLGRIEEPPVAVRERKQPPIVAIAVVAIGVAACVAFALYTTRAPTGAPDPEVAPPDAAAANPAPSPTEPPPTPAAVQKSPPVETTTPPVAAAETPKPAPRPAARPAAKKKVKGSNEAAPQQPVIAPPTEEPIDVEEDGDMLPRIVPDETSTDETSTAEPPAGEPTPPAEAASPETPEEEEPIWDAPPADTPPAEPAPVPSEPAPAEPSTTEPPATEPAPAD